VKEQARDAFIWGAVVMIGGLIVYAWETFSGAHSKPAMRFSPHLHFARYRRDAMIGEEMRGNDHG
jgi:hypothetical protein